MQRENTLIRRFRCLSESKLGAQLILLVLACTVSFLIVVYYRFSFSFCYITTNTERETVGYQLFFFN